MATNDFLSLISTVSTCTDLVLDSLPNNYRIVEKDLNYSYIHNSGASSNIDHCIFSTALSCSTVRVDEDERDYDHLPLAITLCVNQTSRNLVGTIAKKWCYKRDWSNAKNVLYITTLAGLLFNVRVPFYLLYTDTFS